MKAIKFIHNWNNKIDNPVFTTIRSYSESKLKYYCDSVGDDFEILLKGEKVGECVLVGVAPIPYGLVQPQLLMLDTGMTNLEEIDKLFKKFGVKTREDLVIILTFRKK